ncbi:MAG TPA: SiaB family protein kinase [Bacteroidales bacterium]|nr:SiaB family protein kinase [Bacteroidales bacterium]HRW86005.1 SiaB family protein kinase [Bacteroidales bacterium]
MESGKFFFTYKGPVTYEKIDRLLGEIKKSPEFRDLDKTTGKRVYAILVEILENIAKHSAGEITGTVSVKPYVYAEAGSDKIFISSGNMVSGEQKSILQGQLDLINHLDTPELKLFYEDKINRKVKKQEQGAGLGFILIRLKSGNRISFSFTEYPGNQFSFNMEIAVNKYFMRKLAIERTSSSPGVLLDPENNVFEIEGESRPADVSGFYNEILKWFDDFSLYLTQEGKEAKQKVFNFHFVYFNSSSAKYILDLCKLIAASRVKGFDIIVKWYYESDDIDMLEAGREMSKIAKLPFEFVREES